MWENALKKELLKVKVTLELIKQDRDPLLGNKFINYHVIFDVKHDLSRKPRLVVRRHLNKVVLSFVLYSSVMIRESARICFMIAALNDLDIKFGVIGIAYLNVKPHGRFLVIITNSHLFD